MIKIFDTKQRRYSFLLPSLSYSRIYYSPIQYIIITTLFPSPCAFYLDLDYVSFFIHWNGYMRIQTRNSFLCSLQSGYDMRSNCLQVKDTMKKSLVGNNNKRRRRLSSPILIYGIHYRFYAVGLCRLLHFLFRVFIQLQLVFFFSSTIFFSLLFGGKSLPFSPHVIMKCNNRQYYFLPVVLRVVIVKKMTMTLQEQEQFSPYFLPFSFLTHIQLLALTQHDS